MDNLFFCSNGHRRPASNGGMWVGVFAVFLGGGSVVEKLSVADHVYTSSLVHVYTANSEILFCRKEVQNHKRSWLQSATII